MEDINCCSKMPECNEQSSILKVKYNVPSVHSMVTYHIIASLKHCYCISVIRLISEEEQVSILVLMYVSRVNKFVLKMKTETDYFHSNPNIGR